MATDMSPFRIVVTGWRHWSDFRRIWEALRYELDGRGQFLLGVGDCPTGADDIALRWGRYHLNHPVTMFCAAWEQNGPSAGPLRNKFMIDQFRPALVLAFIHPTKSRGTVNCANYAGSQGIAVHRFFERRDHVEEAGVETDPHVHPVRRGHSGIRAEARGPAAPVRGVAVGSGDGDLYHAEPDVGSGVGQE